MLRLVITMGIVNKNKVVSISEENMFITFIWIHQVQTRLLGWVLTQYGWFSCKKGRLGQGCTEE